MAGERHGHGMLCVNPSLFVVMMAYEVPATIKEGQITS